MTSLQSLFKNEEDKSHLIAALSSHGVVTDRCLLLADLTTLSKKSGIIKEHLESFLEIVVHRTHALPIRGDRDAVEESSRAKHWRISSGLSVLDAALSGGLQPGLIAEITGGAQSGKSTIAYHLLATHVLTHPTSSVAYIDTQGTLDPARLASIIQHRLHAHQLQYHHPIPDLTMDGLLDRVKIMRVFDILGILSAIEEIRSSNSDPNAQGEGKIEFLIIDTISTPLSLALTKSQAAGHAHMLTLSRALRSLCTTQQVVALLLNSTVRNMDGGGRVSVFGVAMKPALGGTWRYCVDESWMLSTPMMREVEREDGREWSVVECLRSKRGGEVRWGAIRFEGTDIIGMDRQNA